MKIYCRFYLITQKIYGIGFMMLKNKHSWSVLFTAAGIIMLVPGNWISPWTVRNALIAVISRGLNRSKHSSHVGGTVTLPPSSVTLPPPITILVLLLLIQYKKLIQSLQYENIYYIYFTCLSNELILERLIPFLWKYFNTIL